MRSIFDKKYFQKAGITQSMFNSTQIEELEQIATESYPMGANQVKQLLTLVLNKPESIYDSWTRYKKLSNDSVDMKLKSSLIYVYGELIGSQIYHNRGLVISCQRRHANSYEEGYVNSLEVLREKEITWIKLTPLQQDRVCKLLDYVDRRRHKYLGSTLSWFILQDLTNYVGRYKRIKLAGQTGLYSYVLRYGARLGKELYDDACARKTAHFPNTTGYWVNKGYCKQDAARQVQIIQQERNQRAIELTTGSSEYTVRSLAYWLKKGYTQEQAEQQVHRVQSHARSPEVVASWLQTLANKSAKERAHINLKRSHSIEGVMARGYDLEQATSISIDYFSKRKNYSQISQKMFDMIKDSIGDSGLYYKLLNYERQFNRSCVDLFDAHSGVVIEFFGDYWHANPCNYRASDKVYTKPASLVWLDDKRRLNAIQSHTDVTHVYIIWESEFRSNPTDMVAYAVECINQHRKERLNDGIY